MLAILRKPSGFIGDEEGNGKRIAINTAIGLAASLGIFSIFLLTQKQNPLVVYTALVKCFTENKFNAGEILVYMTPILLAGMSALIPGKVGIVNCGGEGQLIAGALAANIAGVYICKEMPGYIGIPIMFLAGVLAGMLWGVIPLVGKMALGMDETLSTLLMNYICAKFVAYMVFGPIKDPNGMSYPMSERIAKQLRLPAFGTTRANFMIFVALAVVFAVWYLFAKTELGFKMQAIGGNQRAAVFSGLNVKKTQCVAFLVSAGLSGFAGAIWMSGIEFQMRESTATGLGFMGFLATGIVGGKPLLAIPSALMLAALTACGTTLETTTGLKSSATTIFMAVILLVIFCLGKAGKKK